MVLDLKFLTEWLKIFPYKICSIVCDDLVGDIVSVDDVLAYESFFLKIIIGEDGF